MEVVTISEYYRQNIPVPSKYKDRLFWVIRTIVAAGGGGLACLEGIRDAPIVAIHIGASAPLLGRVIGGIVVKKEE